MEETQELTAEEYRVQLLKRNMSARFAEYEDVIATLQTQNQMLRQQNNQLQQALEEADVDVNVPDVAQEPNELPAPPPPPAE